MLDLRAIREDPEPFRAGLARRGAASDLDRLLPLDEKERALKVQVEDLRAEQNRASKEVGRASEGERQRLIESVKGLSEQLEAYVTREDDLYLVGTSEVPLAFFHQDEILEAERLPLRYVGYSTCFRREAGTYGKDMRGIFRVHQFDKVEMFSFCHPDQSWEEHDFLVSVEEEIVRAMGLSYRVVNICTGELGASAAKKIDLEAWLPGQGKYREITSCSNCTDYQARRLAARMRAEDGNRPVHTLNGTAVAIGRMIIAILENHQREDGSVEVPEVLHPYLPEDLHLL